MWAYSTFLDAYLQVGAMYNKRGCLSVKGGAVHFKRVITLRME